MYCAWTPNKASINSPHIQTHIYPCRTHRHTWNMIWTAISVVRFWFATASAHLPSPFRLVHIQTCGTLTYKSLCYRKEPTITRTTITKMEKFHIVFRSIHEEFLRHSTTLAITLVVEQIVTVTSVCLVFQLHNLYTLKQLIHMFCNPPKKETHTLEHFDYLILVSYIGLACICMSQFLYSDMFCIKCKTCAHILVHLLDMTNIIQSILVAFNIVSFYSSLCVWVASGYCFCFCMCSCILYARIV